MKKQNKIPYTFINDYASLISETENLLNENIIGVDIESDSLFHYKEKICLLQISTETKNILIDPLSVKDLSPLSPVFSSHEIRKVLHGSDYDIRSLYRDYKIEVNSLFDTQLAARIAGTNETSLANLLQEYFNVRLKKKYQKKDWSRRPLSESMLTYAVYDTFYLIPLSRILEKQLTNKNRTHWFEEECELLSNVRPAPQNEDPLYIKFKGAAKLPPRDLAMLEAILQLREEIARKKDMPPFKILRNDQIMEIVKKPPSSKEDLESLSDRQIRMMGKAIVKRSQEIGGLPESKLPNFPINNSKSLETGSPGSIKALKRWRQKIAEKLEIDISLVCTNAQIHSLSTSCPKDIHKLKKTGILRNWQIDTYGEEICVILNSIP
ncbi:ribonuclease D [Thermodesulfobacteriota bacterium]